MAETFKSFDFILHKRTFFNIYLGPCQPILRPPESRHHAWRAWLFRPGGVDTTRLRGELRCCLAERGGQWGSRMVTFHEFSGTAYIDHDSSAQISNASFGYPSSWMTCFLHSHSGNMLMVSLVMVKQLGLVNTSAFKKRKTYSLLWPSWLMQSQNSNVLNESMSNVGKFLQTWVFKNSGLNPGDVWRYSRSPSSSPSS